jgi:PAS domain S-box-containing protein
MRHPAAESTHVAKVESSVGFLSSLVENLPDMVFVKDALELKFVRLNRAAEELLGFSRRELLGKSDYDFFPRTEADFFTAKDRAVLAGGKLLDIPEEPIHTRYKGVRILHTKKIPILAKSGTPLYLLGISEDITEKKLAEEERDRSRSRVSLLEAERTLREQFVSTLSHDLRTPLATILAAAQLLLRHPEQRELLSTAPQRIIRSASRADRMIQDLLDVTRIAAGNPLPLKVVATDLAAMAAEIVTEMRGLHPNPISLDVEGPLEGYWSADELGRAIENLLSNAVKHGAPGGAISLAVRPAGAAVKIRVHNVGNPIPPDDLTTIFEPFRRSRRVEQKGTKGWGLGLTLVRAIAEAHGGHVSVESSATEGTRFELVVLRDTRPLVPATEPPPAPAA